jgi:hypothetical protein
VGEGVFAVRMGGSGFVKCLTKAPRKVVAISYNPKYPVREEPEGIGDLDYRASMLRNSEVWNEE